MNFILIADLITLNDRDNFMKPSNKFNLNSGRSGLHLIVSSVVISFIYTLNNK